MKRTALIIATVIMASIVPFADAQKAGGAAPSGYPYEYGALWHMTSSVDAYGWTTGSQRIMKENFKDLLTAVGMKNFNPDTVTEIDLWNYLAGKGWELVQVVEKSGAEETYFRRRKR